MCHAECHLMYLSLYIACFSLGVHIFNVYLKNRTISESSKSSWNFTSDEVMLGNPTYLLKINFCGKTICGFCGFSTNAKLSLLLYLQKDRIPEINVHEMFQNLQIANYYFQESRKVGFFSACIQRSFLSSIKQKITTHTIMQTKTMVLE